MPPRAISPRRRYRPAAGTGVPAAKVVPSAAPAAVDSAAAAPGKELWSGVGGGFSGAVRGRSVIGGLARGVAFILAAGPPRCKALRGYPPPLPPGAETGKLGREVPARQTAPGPVCRPRVFLIHSRPGPCGGDRSPAGVAAFISETSHGRPSQEE